MNMHQLIEIIGDRIDSEKYGHDLKLFHSISVDLCDKLTPEMNAEQIAALAVAKKIWTSKFDEQEWELQIEIFGDLIKNDFDKKNRMVWCALNKNTGFDQFAAEFLALTSHECGLSAEDIYTIMCDHVLSMGH